MNVAITEVLKTIGWDSGFRLPIANEENQALERELARLFIKKNALTQEFTDATNRCKGLTDHLKYVRKEVQENQTLLTTYHQQIDNEKHKLRLKQAEKENILSECRRMAKMKEDINKRLESKKLLLSRNLAKLEKIRSEAEWDTQAMKAWEETIHKRDDDNELLKKFSEEDRRKFMELETKRNNLQAELSCQKDMLTKMDVDVTNYHQVMVRTGKMLATLKEERQALVAQWQNSVRTLRQKDLAIKRAYSAIECLQQQLLRNREEMEEQEAFISKEKNSNKYIQANIHDLTVQSMQMRQSLHQAIEQNHKLVSDQAHRKKQIQRAALDMVKVRGQIKEVSWARKKIKKRVQKILADIESLREQWKEVMMQGSNAAQNGDLLDSLIKDTERIGSMLAKKLQSLLNKQYKMNCSASDLTDVGNMQKVEMCALENALEQIHKRAAVANQTLIHKKQCLSDLDMKIACLEAQIGNADPEEMHDFEYMWAARIQELEEANVQLVEIKTLLHVQILSLQKENLRLVNAISSDTDAHQTLKDKLQTLILQIQGGNKKAKEVTLRSQHLQVHENIIRLKLEKIQHDVKNEDEEIYNMQQYNINLEATFKERYVEITALRDMLSAKQRILTEDRNRLKADIVNREKKNEQIENRYNLGLGMLGKDEFGEPITVASYKVRSAEEKFRLQEESDEMERKIKIAEQEIVAMENTLKFVNMTNKSFKNNLTAVDPESNDAQELKEMQVTFTIKLADLKEKRHERYLQVDFEKQLNIELEQCLEVKQFTQEELEIVQAAVLKDEAERNDREQKLKRAARHSEMCLKKLDKDVVEKYDRDLFIRQVKEINKNVLYHMAEFTANNPAVYAVLRAKFEKRGLEMPTKQRTALSISSDSINSASTSTLASYASAASSRNRAAKATTRKSEQERKGAAVTSLELSFDFPESFPQSRASTISSSGSNVHSRKDSKSKRL